MGMGMDRINGSQVQLVMNIYDIDTSNLDRSDDPLYLLHEAFKLSIT